MNTFSRALVRRRRANDAVVVRFLLALVVVALAFRAVEPARATPVNYKVRAASTASYPVYGGTQVIPFGTDEGTATLTFPFPLRLYGVGWGSAIVSSNGLITFEGKTAYDFVNSCLPASSFPGGEGIAVYWDDLVLATRDNAHGGVIAGASGAAPHRVYAIRWRGRLYDGSSDVDMELLFHEDATTIDMYYGTINASSGTVGVQADPARSNGWYQIKCNQSFGATSGPYAIHWYWDDTPPTVTTTPTPQLKVGSQVGSNGSAPLKLSWLASDGESGVATYTVQQSSDGTSYQNLLYGTTQTSTTVNLAPGYVYPYRVAATNNAGLQSGFKIGSDTRYNAFQETSGSISYTGTWTKTSTSSSSFWGGYERYSTGSGAAATFTCSNCRSMGWVSREDSQRGSAQVYVDGTWVATVSTYASSTVDRAVAYAKTFSSRGTHTLKIVNAGTSGHSKLAVDAFVGL